MRRYTVFTDESGDFDGKAEGRRVVAVVALPGDRVSLNARLAPVIEAALDGLPGGCHSRDWNDLLKFVLHLRELGHAGALPSVFQTGDRQALRRRLYSRDRRAAWLERWISAQRERMRVLLAQELTDGVVAACFERGAAGSDRWLDMVIACVEHAVDTLAKRHVGEELEVEVAPAERSSPAVLCLGGFVASRSTSTPCFASLRLTDDSPGTVLAADSSGSQLADMIANHLGPGAAARTPVSDQAARSYSLAAVEHNLRDWLGSPVTVQSTGACSDSHGEVIAAVGSHRSGGEVAGHRARLATRAKQLTPLTLRVCFDGPLRLLEGVP